MLCRGRLTGASLGRRDAVHDGEQVHRFRRGPHGARRLCSIEQRRGRRHEVIEAGWCGLYLLALREGSVHQAAVGDRVPKAARSAV
jgi:hypothetical protein